MSRQVANSADSLEAFKAMARKSNDGPEGQISSGSIN